MANKAISELPQAQNVNNQDLFVLEQSGIAKKLTAETFITEQGIIDALAEALDGHGGIQSVTLSSVSGRIRTYLITFTDGSATTFQVLDGTSIDRITKTSTAGLVDTYTVFMSDGTTTFFTVTNGADGTVSEAMLNDALKDKAPAVTETTESSAIANFTDGADNMPLHNILAEINPVQDDTYGDPYPAGGGKNKLPAILNTIKSLNIMGTWSGNAYMVNGLTFTVSANDEGAVTQISVSGTASANSVFIIARPLSVTSGQILNGAPSEGRFFVSNSAGTTDYAKDLGSGATISTTDDSAYCYIQLLNGTTLTGAVYKPMLRDSSVSDATFAPYSNICPITGFTGCNVTRTGVNIWDEEWEVGSLGNNGEPIPGDNNTIRSKNYIPCMPETEYCIPMYSNQSGAYVYGVYQYDAEKNHISFVSINSYTKIFTTAPNAYYLKFRTFVAYGTTYNHDISINYPASDTEYHAYQGQTVSLSWQTEAGTVYGGTIDVATGLLTVDMAIVDMGALAWTYNSGNNRFDGSTISSSKRWPNPLVTPNAVCECLKTVSFNNLYQGADNAIAFDTRELRARCTTFGTNADAFKTAVTGQSLVYELATPQTYQLTGQQLKTLLGTNNVWADTGNVSVTYAADTKMFIEKLTMPTEDDLVANQAITSGKYFMIGNSLYLALANIASGAQITIGTNAQRVSLADALNTINS